MKKVIGIGKQSFEDIIQSNCFYIERVVGIRRRYHVDHKTETFWKNVKYGYVKMFFFQPVSRSGTAV